MKKEPNPLSLPCYIGVSIFFAAVLLGFCLLLRQNFLHIESEDFSAWSASPEPLSWACEVHAQADSASYDGYLYLAGEPLHSVNNRVGLYHAASGGLEALPSCMIVRDIPELTGGPINHAYGGFSAFVKAPKLEYPLEEYEICLLYASNGHHYIQPTGLNGKGEPLC